MQDQLKTRTPATSRRSYFYAFVATARYFASTTLPVLTYGASSPDDDRTSHVVKYTPDGTPEAFQRIT